MTLVNGAVLLCLAMIGGGPGTERGYRRKMGIFGQVGRAMLGERKSVKSAGPMIRGRRMA
jgi:hypothetical protein